MSKKKKGLLELYLDWIAPDIDEIFGKGGFSGFFLLWPPFHFKIWWHKIKKVFGFKRKGK